MPRDIKALQTKNLQSHGSIKELFRLLLLRQKLRIELKHEKKVFFQLTTNSGTTQKRRCNLGGLTYWITIILEMTHSLNYVMNTITKQLELENQVERLDALYITYICFEDLVGWTRHKPHNSFYIVIIGVLKKCNEKVDEFSNEDKGQLVLISFLEDLSKFQQHRNEFTGNYHVNNDITIFFKGFLSNGKLIQFFKLFTKDEIRLFETPVFYLNNEGGEYLMGLLNTPLEQLGNQQTLNYSKQEIIIDRVLGVGGSSIVYAAKLPSIDIEEVVVKHFRPNHLIRLQPEKENLQLLKNIEYVTQIIGVSDDGGALILKPLGQSFACSEKDYSNNEKCIPSA